MRKSLCSTSCFLDGEDYVCNGLQFVAGAITTPKTGDKNVDKLQGELGDNVGGQFGKGGIGEGVGSTLSKGL